MRVGDLARATGLTVRALHHYDELGLVASSGRTGPAQASRGMVNTGAMAYLHEVLSRRA